MSAVRVFSAAIAAIAVLATAGCAAAKPIVRTEIDLLGTVCTISVWRPDDAAVEAAFARILEIDRRMSAQRDDSEVAAVNRAAGGGAVRVSADTFAVIREALSFSRLSGGAFDITVGPLVKLWGIGTDGARVPAASEVAAALKLVDWHSVELSEAGSSIRLPRPGMAIDLGAIAKGYAGDEVVGILAARGVSTALVDLGGNVVTLGSKPDGSPWRIGLQDPEAGVPRGTHIGILEIVGSRAVVTSGVYERFFVQDGVRYHHILDTQSGSPVRNGLAAVTVVTERSTEADGWSTTLFALGLERGRILAEGRGIETVFITEARDVYATPGVRPRLRLTDSRYKLRGW